MGKRARARREERARDAVRAAAEGPAQGSRSERRRWIVVAVAVFAIAFAIRAAVAWQLAAHPMVEKPQLDSIEFLVWAKSIAQGEELRWRDPSHGPGYPVFLAALLTILGESLRAIALVQAALGAALAVVAASLAARLFRDWRAGLAAGLLVALYGPLIYLEVSLFAEGLFTFLLLLALWLLAEGKIATGNALAIGALVGAAVVTRATAIPFLPAVVLLILVGWSRWPRRSAVWMIAAWLALVAPVLLMLRQVSGDWIPIQVFGGLNFYMGNRPGASGTPEGRLGGSWDRLYHEPDRHGVTGAAARERFYMDKAWREIGERPMETMRTIGRKAVWLVQHDEVRDNYHYFRTQAWALRWLPGFGVLFPLAAWGLWLALSKRRLPPEIALYLALFAASNLLIVVSCRYRIPLVPVLAIAGGGAAVWLFDRIRGREWKALLPAGAVVVAAVVVSQLWRHEPSHDFSEEWSLTAGSLASLGRYDEAQEAIDRALAANPRSALAWYYAGLVQLRVQNAGRAEEALANAVRLNPDYLDAHLRLAGVLKERGDLARAEKELREAVRIAPLDPIALVELGETLMLQGKLDEARPVLRRMTEIDPASDRAWLALARLEGAARNPRAGVAMAERAVTIAPSRADAWVLLAMLAIDAGDAATAERAIAEAERLAGPNDPATVFARSLLARMRASGAAGR